MTDLYPYGNSITLDYVNFEDPTSYSTNNCPIFFEDDSMGQSDSPSWSFTNINIDTRTNSGWICDIGTGDWASCIFDNWNTSDTYYGMRVGTAGGALIKFTNSMFQRIFTYSFLYGGQGNLWYKSQYGNTYSKTLMNQPKITSVIALQIKILLVMNIYWNH